MLLRAQPSAVRRARAMKGNAARADKVLKRLIRQIVSECRPLAPKLNDRSLMLDIVKLVVRHRRIGYQRGWNANFMGRRRLVNRMKPRQATTDAWAGTEATGGVLEDIEQRLRVRAAGGRH